MTDNNEIKLTHKEELFVDFYVTSARFNATLAHELAKYAARHNIKSLRVIIPGIGQRFLHTYLPDAHAVQLDDPIEPGWYAVNIRVEQFIPALLREPEGPYSSTLIKLAKQWELYWQRVKQGKDYGYVAGTFHLYYLEPRGDLL